MSHANNQAELLTTRPVTIGAELLHVTYEYYPADEYGSPEAYDIYQAQYGEVDIWPVLSETPGAGDVLERAIQEAELRERRDADEDRAERMVRDE